MGGLRRQRASANAGQNAFDLAKTRYLHPKSRVRVFEPQWEGKLPTAVKILPEYDHEAKEYRPYRDSADDSVAALGAFRMPLPIVKWVGTAGAERSLSCILYDPQEDRESDGEISRVNPYNVLRSAVRSAAYKGRDIRAAGKRIDTSVWLKYFNGARDDKAFPTAQMGAFMQAVFYTNRGKSAVDDQIPRGCGPQDDPMLLLVSGRAAETIDKMLCETTDAHRGDGEASEYDSMFVYGDVTRIDGGKILVLANPESHDFSAVTGNEEDDDLIADAKKSDFKSYVPLFTNHVIIKDEQTRRRVKFGPSLAKYEKVLKDRAVDWFAEDLFVIPSIDQLCEWLASAFAVTPEILEFGWSDYPEYFELDSVQRIIKNRTQGYVPGAADDSDDEDDDGQIVDADDPDNPDVDGDAVGMSRKKRIDRMDKGAKSTRDKSRAKNAGASVYDNVQNTIGDDTPVSEDEGDDPNRRKTVRVVRRKKK